MTISVSQVCSGTDTPNTKPDDKDEGENNKPPTTDPDIPGMPTDPDYNSSEEPDENNPDPEEPDIPGMPGDNNENTSNEE